MSTNNKEPQAMERKIATALDSSTITAADLAVLIDATEVAITSAVEAERAKAFDLIVSPDAAMAHAAMTDATFMRERLRTVLPLLRERYQEVAAKEYRAAWNADCDAVEVGRDALAAEFREVYRQAIMAKFVDLLIRMSVCDRECYRVNASAPAGEPRRLAGPELLARGLESFSRDNPSIAAELRIPSFDRGGRMAWPPQQTLDPALFSPVSAFPRYSADWGRAAEEEARVSQVRQKREAAEREAEAFANRRGSRWWKGERA